MRTELIEKIQSQGFCITEEDAVEIEKLDRFFPVMVRCGGVRFSCSIQYLKTMISYVENSGDYVRDVNVQEADLWKI